MFNVSRMYRVSVGDRRVCMVRLVFISRKDSDAENVVETNMVWALLSKPETAQFSSRRCTTNLSMAPNATSITGARSRSPIARLKGISCALSSQFQARVLPLIDDMVMHGQPPRSSGAHMHMTGKAVARWVLQLPPRWHHSKNDIVMQSQKPYRRPSSERA